MTREEIEKIIEEVIARTCSLFGASLSDLQPEDKEIQMKATDQLLQLHIQGVREIINKESFEANLLDGDKIEDSGNAMLSAKYVWEYLEELLEGLQPKE